MNLKDSIDENERRRLYVVWEGTHYTTGETTENGGVVCRLSAPPNNRAWWHAFERHVAQLWFDCEQEWLARHIKEKRGANAYNPQLKPLVEIAKARGTFHLSDPMTYLVWLDFLGKFPERGQAWKEFQREHGETETLNPTA